jgi:hypothetical protein
MAFIYEISLSYSYSSVTCHKILRRETSGFTSPAKEGVLWIICLKSPSPRLDLNPRTFDPITRTLTITPQKRLGHIYPKCLWLPTSLYGVTTQKTNACIFAIRTSDIKLFLKLAQFCALISIGLDSAGFSDPFVLTFHHSTELWALFINWVDKGRTKNSIFHAGKRNAFVRLEWNR